MITQGKWEIHTEILNSPQPCYIYGGEFSTRVCDFIELPVLAPDDVKQQQADNARLIATSPELLAACKMAAKLILTARQYYPKSMHNNNKFDLENTNATIMAAIAKAEGGRDNA